MRHLSIPRHGWVLVCDGAKALFFRNDGDAELLNLTLVHAVAENHGRNRELGSDRPGRVYQSHGKARSATTETDWHAEGERAFLAGVAKALDGFVEQHAVRNLVLVAPPKALGVLRAQMTARVRGIVAVEIPKDLARLSTGEIERHLAEEPGRSAARP